ncbi:hypothetical protein EV122DRAFT_293566 [Schizophyllum commune]
MSAPLQRLYNILGLNTSRRVATSAPSDAQKDLNDAGRPRKPGTNVTEQVMNIAPHLPQLANAAMLMGENTTVLGPEVLHMVMQNCSPHDLAVLRRVCRAFKQHIDERPALWRSARKAMCDAPEPSALPPLKGSRKQAADADEIHEGLTEAEWALHLFTGALETKRGYQAVPMLWLVDYKREWTKSHIKNMGIISEFIREKERLGVDAKKRRVREFLRTPVCVGLLRAFRRDLEDVDYATLARAYPEIVDQAARAKTGDLSMLPPGYRLHSRDNIVCPTCHPPVKREYTLDSKLKKIVYLEKGEPMLNRKEPKKYMIGDGIQNHYTAKHSSVKPPFLRVTFACGACPTAAKPRLYCNQGMIAHHHNAHGPINPAW